MTMESQIIALSEWSSQQLREAAEIAAEAEIDNPISNSHNAIVRTKTGQVLLSNGFNRRARLYNGELVECERVGDHWLTPVEVSRMNS